MKLIYDTVMTSPSNAALLEARIVQDNINSPKKFKLFGPQCVANVKNVNRRIYPRETLDAAVKYLVENWVKKNRCLGELEHPTYNTINPSEACDRLISLYQSEEDENMWVGESEVLASDPAHGIHGTPKGDVLAGLLSHGTAVGRSTRGVGDCDEATGIVAPNYRLICIDTVLDPSAPGCCSECIVEGILQHREFMINEHNEIVEIPYEQFVKSLNRLPVRNRDEYVSECVRRFLGSI
jgi:hypothetical protein